MKRLIYLTIFTVLSVNANAAFSTGKVNIVESYANDIFVQWTGPNAESCQRKTLVFNVNTLGNEKAVERAYATVLAAVASGKSLRVQTSGCYNTRQKVVGIQICANDDCSY